MDKYKKLFDMFSDVALVLLLEQFQEFLKEQFKRGHFNNPDLFEYLENIDKMKEIIKGE